MDEFGLIERYFARKSEAPGVVTGIGDDGAVLQPDAGFQLVDVIDTLVAETHFPEDIAAADLGYRVVAVNLSDIAAMGGRPRWMTLALTVPAADEAWIDDFARGLFEAADACDVALVGGDLTHGDTTVATVHITGDVEAGKAIRRSGAAVGDSFYVTGTVGDAAAGLELLQSGLSQEFLSARFLRPSPRVEFGRTLIGVATAAIDISDGLLGDLKKLTDASGVGAELDLDALPISDALAMAFDPGAQRQFALTGGDDYELLFTSASDIDTAHEGVSVTRIGSVVAGAGITCRDVSGIVEFEDSGYRHFE